jgi:hypothetical protein
VIEQSVAWLPRLPSHSVTHSSARNRKVAEAAPAAPSRVQAAKTRNAAEQRRRRVQHPGARPRCQSWPNARPAAGRVDTIARGTIDLNDVVAIGSILLRPAGWSKDKECCGIGPLALSGITGPVIGRVSSLCQAAVDQASLGSAGGKSPCG